MRFEDKMSARTQRARRKLRALRAARRQALSAGRAKTSPATAAHHTWASVEPVSALAPALANALATAHAAYMLCAARTVAPNVATAATNAASELAKLGAPTKARLGDRLRLEWLAATNAGAPNGPDAHLLAECARILGDAIALTAGAPAQVADRIRLVSAEAYSLSSAVQSEARWRPTPARVALLSLAR